MGDLGFEIFIICERIAIAQSSSVLSALLCLVSAYFSFNIEYLPTFKNVLVFLQRVILEIEDELQMPNSVLQVCSVLDKL